MLDEMLDRMFDEMFDRMLDEMLSHPFIMHIDGLKITEIRLHIYQRKMR